jgi:hypothetical protein
MLIVRLEGRATSVVAEVAAKRGVDFALAAAALDAFGSSTATRLTPPPPGPRWLLRRLALGGRVRAHARGGVAAGLRGEQAPRRASLQRGRRTRRDLWRLPAALAAPAPVPRQLLLPLLPPPLLPLCHMSSLSCARGVSGCCLRLPFLAGGCLLAAPKQPSTPFPLS